MTSITPLNFIEKWQKTTIKESAAAQSHFNDMCELLGHPKPLEADPDGWPHDLSDEEILENLFTLNQERAKHAH